MRTMYNSLERRIEMGAGAMATELMMADDTRNKGTGSDSPVQKQYYTVQEMATIMGVPYRTMLAVVNAGEMPVIRLGRGHKGAMLVEIADFDRWRATRKFYLKLPQAGE